MARVVKRATGYAPGRMLRITNCGFSTAPPQSYLGEQERLFYVSELNASFATHVKTITKVPGQVSDWPERESKDEQHY
jgi:hypothetical protein